MKRCFLFSKCILAVHCGKVREQYESHIFVFPSDIFRSTCISNTLAVYDIIARVIKSCVSKKI